MKWSIEMDKDIIKFIMSFTGLDRDTIIEYYQKWRVGKPCNDNSLDSEFEEGNYSGYEELHSDS